MIRTIALTLGALTAAAALAAPAVASAQVAIPLTTYTTSLTQVGPLASPGAYTGKLTFTVSPDGIVQGWYVPDDESTYVPVSGGEKDGKLWLNIGDRGSLQITADVLADGSLSGSGFETAAAPSSYDALDIPTTFSFTATLTKG
ncbi:MAG TPA: hypothetical protein VN934_10080 [Candidatus Tumulicola sp.]|nr:hypothetical protein [Candidatus Tumulicola sp.]